MSNGWKSQPEDARAASTRSAELYVRFFDRAGTPISKARKIKSIWDLRPVKSTWPACTKSYQAYITSFRLEPCAYFGLSQDALQPRYLLHVHTSEFSIQHPTLVLPGIIALRTKDRVCILHVRYLVSYIGPYLKVCPHRFHYKKHVSCTSACCSPSAADFFSGFGSRDVQEPRPYTTMKN